MVQTEIRKVSIVLVLGSAPDSVRAKEFALGTFDAIVSINNAWRVTPDWTHSIFPYDFPSESIPETSVGQVLVNENDFVPAQNRFGGFVYAGGTMAYTAGYWALSALQPSVIAYLGCDMVYGGKQTHFYGRGEPDPLREDPTLRRLEAKSARLELIAAGEGCATVNLSERETSRLVFRRWSIDYLERKTAIPTRPGIAPLVSAARRMEQELAYHVESGRYWEEVGRFDLEEIDRLDRTWLAALGARAQFGHTTTAYGEDPPCNARHEFDRL